MNLGHGSRKLPAPKAQKFFVPLFLKKAALSYRRPMEERDDDAPIKSVRKAIDILDVLSDARRPLRVSDIAARLGMSVSAVSRLIPILAKRPLVYQDEETGRCYLGLGLTVLGAD